MAKNDSEHDKSRNPQPKTQPHPHELPPALQKIVDKADKEDNFYDELYEGTSPPSTESNIRYAAYASRIRTALISAQRYVAYTSDIGESFRPIAHPNLVRTAYGISWAYLAGDVAHEGYKAYCNNQRILHPELPREADAKHYNDAMLDPSSASLDAQIAAAPKKVAPLDDWRTVMAQRAVFQSLASMGLPAFTIHSIVRYSGRALKNVKSSKIRGYGPIGLGLAIVPALPYIFDEPVEQAVEWVFHKGVKVFEGPDAVKGSPETGREKSLQRHNQKAANKEKELDFISAVLFPPKVPVASDCTDFALSLVASGYKAHPFAAMASSSRSDPADETTTTFTTMDEKDPTLIGTHCQYAYCNQLDFLPFRCESCRGTFCLDHRSESGHKCPKAGEWAARRRRANLATPSLGAGKSMVDVERPCASPTCKTTIGTSLSTAVHCSSCNRDYCLKHRLNEDHDCKNLVPIGARPSKFGKHPDYAKTALGKLKAWGISQKANMSQRVLPKPKPTSAAARLVAVNNLKKTAKGEAKIPPEKRVYIYVEAEAATTTSKLPSGEFYYSKDWVIGRVLDAAAKSLQVQNINNQGMDEASKLRVFHVEGGRLLEFNEKVGDALVSGNRVVLLRGVGPAIPNLIEA
ncbi:uncharacterized protein BP5553_04174 [Venustampulla echinocandica]|uniref:Mitochondrial fission process protein 1 n=1 Tax=Venustampulla echinocandica TaxID=2656787 RepID=A0A370TWC8_9HELO|nr:uncharacterized protein BP5553_04174 [Venustampulla echinocandica]RDL39834.1 hypothetical protein BP5553_04174 [Venustampulla echinocandica]